MMIVMPTPCPLAMKLPTSRKIHKEPNQNDQGEGGSPVYHCLHLSRPLTSAGYDARFVPGNSSIDYHPPTLERELPETASGVKAKGQGSMAASQS